MPFDFRKNFLPMWGEWRLVTWGCLGVAMVQSIMALVFSFWQSEFINSMTQKALDDFWRLLTLLPLILGAEAILSALNVKFSTSAVLQLRKTWAQQDASWLKDFSIWGATAKGGEFDMTQSMSEDPKEQAELQIQLLAGLSRAVMTLLLFGVFLGYIFPSWTWAGIWIPVPMLLFTLTSFAVSAGITHQLGKKLPDAETKLAQAEGHFRALVARVRENARSVGILKGEGWEARAWIGLLHHIEAATKQLAGIKAKLYGVSELIGPTDILALLVLSPMYFSGEINFGQVFQAGMAHKMMGGALDWFAQEYSSFARWQASRQRRQAWRSQLMRWRENKTMHVENGTDDMRTRNLSIWVPGTNEYTQGTEVADFVWHRNYPDLHIRTGENVWLKAPSGWGKSSFLAVLSGSWPCAAGYIKLPDDLVFVPQQTYFPKGNLAEAMHYPQAPQAHAHAMACQWLETLGLGHLNEGLTGPVRDWNATLSGGEAARLSLVRALLQKPKWLVLDEPTANLDTGYTRHYWQLLAQQQALRPDLTVVLISHLDPPPEWAFRVVDLTREAEALSSTPCASTPLRSAPATLA